MGENILVVPAKSLVLDEGLLFGIEVMEHVMQSMYVHGVFKPRNEVEGNPEYRQIIPYALIQRVTPDTIETFLFKRIKGSEERLKNKFSIGVGGHINEEDQKQLSQEASRLSAWGHPAIEAEDESPVKFLHWAQELMGLGLYRELNEELEISAIFNSYTAGILNDLRDPVGRDHLGVLYSIRMFSNKVRSRNTEIEGRFVDDLDLAGVRMEGWSELVWERMDELVDMGPGSSLGLE